MTGPKKIEKSCVGSKLLHHVYTMACSSSWPLIDYLVSNDNGSVEAASPCGWPNNFSCHLPVFAANIVDSKDSLAFAVDFLDDGKLGYEFTSADDLKRLTSVLGISHGRHLSAISWIRPCVRR